MFMNILAPLWGTIVVLGLLAAAASIPHLRKERRR
ncbi:hypothetical protein CCUG60884_00193 [Mycobacteroides salmoniphilum]|uniref:Uncharacterized protein n=1 Tax=Mycobacteroides salmoniphilum TaxID=404941 RepID=A0A4R8T022_9MYCO|nr:hypothetical protein CCUG60884_00193 [Mycobacteroides salmoniphilum]